MAKKRKTKKQKAKEKKILFALIAFACAGAVLFLLYNNKTSTMVGVQNTVTVSTLEKVIKTSSLSTYETVYNGVSVLMNEEKPDIIDCYVSYNASIKAGLDFNKIEVKKDEENHSIIVTLPQVEIQSPTVRIEESDYIVINKKINHDGLSAKAYKKCIEDARSEAKKQDAIYKYAKENAERLIEGLIAPFVNQMDNNYMIKFEWKE